MAYLVDVDSFDPVYRLETGDDVLGGPLQISNWQAQALANRDKYLLDRLEAQYFKYKDTASMTLAYPLTASLAIIPATFYEITGNAATYTLPFIHASYLPEMSVFAFSCVAGNRCYLKGLGGDEFYDPTSGYPQTDTLTIFAGETVILQKPEGAATAWNVLMRLNDGEPGKITLRNGAPGNNGHWQLCHGASVLVADYPRLFAKIGYNFGGAGASFNLPTIADIGSGASILMSWIDT